MLKFYLATSAEAVAGKYKQKSNMPVSSKRKTFTAEAEKDKKKKPDIYEAMKGAGFGAPQPKIVTNNVRAYKF